MNPALIILSLSLVLLALVVVHATQRRTDVEERRETRYAEWLAEANRAHAATLAAVVEGQRRQEAHVLEVLNRFLSRSFEEHQYTRMVAGQVIADQEDDADDEQANERRARVAYQELEERMVEETARRSAAQGGG